MTKRAVLYARVSGDDRHTEGRNLQGQLDMCREYAVQRGYEVIEELAEDDRGASGAAFELPQLNRVRELARIKAFDVLVTRELDRLSRNLAKQLFVEEELRRSGVVLEYALAEYPDTPEGNLMKNIRASVAEFERLKIAERMVRGRDLKIRAGNVITHGTAPFGYREVRAAGKATLEVVETEASIVRQIFQWYTVGDGGGEPLSMCKIQVKLNQLQVPTFDDLRPGANRKRKGYGEWGRSQIGRILSNETYAGVWHYRKTARRNGKLVPRPSEEHLGVEVPAIIELPTWQLAQEHRAEGKDKSKRNLKYRYLLRRRVTCGLCGAKMIGFPARGPGGKQYFYYKCPAANDHRSTNYARECNAPSFRLEDVESRVWEWVKSILLNPVEQEQGLRALAAEQELEVQPLRERLAHIEAALQENRRQQERLLDLFLTKSFPEDVLEKRSAKLKQVIDGLEHERLDLTRQLSVQRITEEDIRDLRSFGLLVGQKLKAGGDDFSLREYVIDELDLRTRLTVEDGVQVAHVRCAARPKEEAIPIVSQTSRSTGSSG